jgi:hypothetical protein
MGLVQIFSSFFCDIHQIAWEEKETNRSLSKNRIPARTHVPFFEMAPGGHSIPKQQREKLCWVTCPPFTPEN